MTAAGEERESTEGVAVFETAAGFQQAIDELPRPGLDRVEMSLSARRRTVDETPGHAGRRAREIEDDPMAPYTFCIPSDAIADAKGAGR
ncbi:hypothetical protein [Emcibacter sp. SYSU 3D8]|uniref:hypothetical protein n=1 Tax=Emcibacter sp. SYSU 3D8 TaxID=3133969 RepID=UPI0031FF3F83